MNSHIVVVEDDVDQLANYSYALSKKGLRFQDMSRLTKSSMRYLGNLVWFYSIFTSVVIRMRASEFVSGYWIAIQAYQ